MRKLEKKDFIKNFWSRINIKEENDCWEWNSRTERNGYGIYQTAENFGLSRFAHRCAWQLQNGDTNNLFVLHKCDNPKCCNINHLFLGTQKDNMEDKVNKNRQTKGESCNFSKLTIEQVRLIRKDLRFQKIIALEYGMHQSAISLIKNNKTWNNQI